MQVDRGSSSRDRGGHFRRWYAYLWQRTQPRLVHLLMKIGDGTISLQLYVEVYIIEIPTL